MKKTTIIILTALLGMGLTSCKKDYTCECSYSISYQGMNLGSYSTTEPIENSTKKKAKDRCDKLGDDIVNAYTKDVPGATGSSDCSLK